MGTTRGPKTATLLRWHPGRISFVGEALSLGVKPCHRLHGLTVWLVLHQDEDTRPVRRGGEQNKASQTLALAESVAPHVRLVSAHSFPYQSVPLDTTH